MSSVRVVVSPDEASRSSPEFKMVTAEIDRLCPTCWSPRPERPPCWTFTSYDSIFIFVCEKNAPWCPRPLGEHIAGANRAGRGVRLSIEMASKFRP
jgi:hypothetical protein